MSVVNMSRSNSGPVIFKQSGLHNVRSLNRTLLKEERSIPIETFSSREESRTNTQEVPPWDGDTPRLIKLSMPVRSNSMSSKLSPNYEIKPPVVLASPRIREKYISPFLTRAAGSDDVFANQNSVSSTDSAQISIPRTNANSSPVFRPPRPNSDFVQLWKGRICEVKTYNKRMAESLIQKHKQELQEFDFIHGCGKTDEQIPQTLTISMTGERVVKAKPCGCVSESSVQNTQQDPYVDQRRRLISRQKSELVSLCEVSSKKLESLKREYEVELHERGSNSLEAIQLLNEFSNASISHRVSAKSNMTLKLRTI